VQAVRHVSFAVDAGKTLGIVGESGSGKSVSAQTMMGLTRGARISGRALFEGIDVLAMTPRELQEIRGSRIAMVFQDPLSSLHPFYRVGWQIAEMLRAHDKSVSKKAARSRAIDLLRLVGIPQPATRVDDFPHQFSGGMRQRAMIAMAMALNPKLLIADEPTTALDVTVQAQVLEVMKRLQEEFGTAIIMITHDLGVIADVADDVVVMYAGATMEMSARNDMFYAHHHPYTEGLLESLPAYGDERQRLRPIKGQPPSLINVPTGCPYHPRCPYVMDVCRTDVPPLRDIPGPTRHVSACWLPVDRAAHPKAGEVA
jgi:oligopeptide/dipeptide ABC transporter ATP-binding protein